MIAAAHPHPRPRSAWAYGGVALAALVVSTLVLSVLHDRQQQGVWDDLQRRAHGMATRIDQSVEDGPLAGGVRLMGVVDRQLKEMLQRPAAAAPHDAAHRQALALRGLTLGADGLLVVDTNGRVVAAWDPDHDLTSAPIWHAPQGASAQDETTGAIQIRADTRTLDHSILLLAPIWLGDAPTPGQPETQIGTLVARMSAGTLRRHLALPDARSALAAPHGRLVAAGHPAAALRTAPDRDEGSAPTRRVAVAQDRDGMGAARLVARQALDWPTGSAEGGQPWAVVLTRDLPPVNATAPAALWAWGSGAGTALALLAGMAALRTRQRQRETAQQQRTVAEQAARRDAWRTLLGEAAIGLQGSADAREAARRFLDIAHARLGAVQGVVYERQPDRLALLATWACPTEPPASRSLEAGVLAQVVRDRRPIDLGVADVTSGLGRAPPARQLVLPLHHHDEVLGVAELAWLNSPPADAPERAHELAELLALNLRLLRQRA